MPGPNTFRWYVKARYQEDHVARAIALGCDAILEDTSEPVDPGDPLPHVLIQTRNKTPQGRVNHVFPDLPNSRASLAALNAVINPSP